MAEEQQTGREPDGSLLEDMRMQLRRDPAQPPKQLKLPPPAEPERPGGIRRLFRR